MYNVRKSQLKWEKKVHRMNPKEFIQFGWLAGEFVCIGESALPNLSKCIAMEKSETERARAKQSETTGILTLWTGKENTQTANYRVMNVELQLKSTKKVFVFIKIEWNSLEFEMRVWRLSIEIRGNEIVIRWFSRKICVRNTRIENQDVAWLGFCFGLTKPNKSIRKEPKTLQNEDDLTHSAIWID